MTEMYSAICAEVPLPSDPETQINHDLLQQLELDCDRLIIGGQAMSHCVRCTVLDIVKYWKSDPKKIYLLEDGNIIDCSPLFRNNLFQAALRLPMTMLEKLLIASWRRCEPR